MSSTENKKLVQQIFSELANGNARPLVEHMTEDFVWTVTGTTEWSRRYEGKKKVIGELFAGLQSRLNPPITTIAERFIADGDYVAVEARGRNTTKEGKTYNNQYCFVFRVSDGKLREVTEYMDTHLVVARLG